MILQKREDDRQRSMVIIAVGNVIAILLGLLVLVCGSKGESEEKGSTRNAVKGT